jgi:hypothetical protein
MRGRGSQELRPRVEYRRSGPPDFGVCTRRYENRYKCSGPQGTRDHVLRLQRRLRRLCRAVEHSAEGQENIRGLLRGVLEEMRGS